MQNEIDQGILDSTINVNVDALSRQLGTMSKKLNERERKQVGKVGRFVSNTELVQPKPDNRHF
jgi:hypothetical protein